MNSKELKLFNQTLALAGIFQVCVLVRDLATTGECDEQAFQTCIHSIYKIDAANVAEVYGSIKDLKKGLNALYEFVENKKPKITDPQMARYLFSLTHLERRLSKLSDMQKQIQRRVQYASSQAVYFSETHSTVIASLADIYLNTLGTLPFRVQIIGQAKFLNQEIIVNKIRALMLAGVRSAVLWHQMGGRRLQFLWARKNILVMTKKLVTI